MADLSLGVYGRALLTMAGASLLLAGSTIVMGQPQNEPASQPGQAPPGQVQPDGQPGQRPPRGPGQRPDGPREFTSLDGAMKGLRQGLRLLRESAGDPARKEVSLQAVTGMQRACLAAKSFQPKKLREGSTLEGYRREQIRLMGMLLELETHLLDGQHDQAKAMVEKLVKFRDDAHEKFGEGEDEGGGGDDGSGGKQDR